MSKFSASKSTGLPPVTATRLQLPDARINEPQLSQDDRQKARNQRVGTGKPFQRVGIVGPQK